MAHSPNPHSLRIGFVSTRFAGTDGVSLETAKWTEVLEALGHTCYYFAGLCDRPPQRSMVVPEAFYRHPEVFERHNRFFSGDQRTADDTRWVHHWREFFRDRLAEFIQAFRIDLLVPQNMLAIPLQIPLGLALTELIAETNFPTVAHHHDFAWERKRFLVNGVGDYISAAFPPDLDSISHVVINTAARHQLARRRGVASTVIPNVMDFDREPPRLDDYAADVRQALGLEADEYFILQPTRIIQRKGIEHAVELVHRLGLKASLVISHASGDEGDEYAQRVRQYARLLNVKVIFCADRVGDERGRTEDGRKIYRLWDLYHHADLVTYPSLYEGFGNAFLETVWMRRPIVVNNYSIYATDIRPKGFAAIEIDDYVTDGSVAQARNVLLNPELGQKMAVRNFELAAQYFSYKMLRRKLRGELANFFGVAEPAS
ncbi:MAG: glycosyltransferase family 4 protein [Chloroflexi bacterium]|nr:glycosyltransferase family 4 protein [Chloroflexota bacterium]MCI0580447.1 glycosyltransferase family 4 protein [Chloroflexota bacterium]MCI0649191.1 glycosyltransferase family 4 protein [Chloroflexota bacterium]MCI0727997.1 glycosyltransferase family 4 protein [Chloroflexota bacterium]